MKKKNKLIVLALLFSFSATALAAKSLGEISDTLIGGADILAKVMWAACIIVGIGLIAAAFTQFQIHRSNPKLVPLTTPVMYVILGVIALCIPFGERILGYLDSYIAEDQRYEYPSTPTPTTPDDRYQRR